MKDNLVVSEKFYSLQGEGQTMGVPAVFVRLAGCNILCKSESWVCDTIEVWQKGIPVNFEDLLDGLEVERLREGAHLIWTGGEPMLHQKKIIAYMTWFEEKYNFIPILEIETNGTIMPSDEVYNLFDYFNCSPKLSNSGEPKARRIKQPSIRKINSHKKSIFKFVISCEEDIVELYNDYGNLIDDGKIVLMPAGESHEQLAKTRLLVANSCVTLGLRYSERLHIVIWNQKTGV